MTTTSPSSRPDPTRSGAVWVTGAGAFLLFAAAAVFTAVRWDEIPDAAKLAALVAATGACLLGGRGLRPTLPASAGALFHLGAFLVPVDAAALAVRAELDWPTMLLAQGIVATITFGWAATIERSVVLRWAFGAAVVALAAGIGATTPVPAPLVLGGFALVALAVDRTDAALGWAVIAGMAPLLTFLDSLSVDGSGLAARLGLVGEQPQLLAVITGAAAAAVLAVEGRRRDDAGLALIGIALAGTGALASWQGLHRDTSDHLVALAVVFLAVEVAAHLARRDVFWAGPANISARVAEAGATLASGATVAVAAVSMVFEVREPTAALACAVLGAAWIVADLRSDGRGRLGATVGIAAAAVSAVALATHSFAAVSLTFTAVAAAAVLVPRFPIATGLARRRPGSAVVAVVGALAGPLVGIQAGLTIAVTTGALGSVLLAEAAVRRSWEAAEGDAGQHESWAWLLSTASLAPIGIALAAVAERTGAVTVTLVGGVVVATALAALTDRGRTASADIPLGSVARVGGVALLAGTVALRPVEIGLVALAVATMSALDGVRLRQPMVALGASVALPVAVGALCHSAALSLPATGVALTVSAAVMAGLGSQLGGRWCAPVVTAVGLAIGGGLVLASTDPSSLADAITISGGIGLATAVGTGSLLGVYLSGSVVTAGIWLRLADSAVGASEPYLLPVGALLLIAGLRARSIGTSSWIAYGPLVGLLGGSALIERVAGGPGWHGVIAGTVAVVAVAAGGARRLAAPLLLGTTLLVALVAFETLAVTSTLPTWTWLALGGAVLLGAGVAMERRDVGPLETGRRLVDVISQGYA